MLQMLVASQTTRPPALAWVGISGRSPGLPAALKYLKTRLRMRFASQTALPPALAGVP